MNITKIITFIPTIVWLALGCLAVFILLFGKIPGAILTLCALIAYKRFHG